MRKLATVLALLAIISVGMASAVNYDVVRQVENSGPTNFVGTNYLPPDDSGTDWTPLQVGDTFPGIDDFSQAAQIPVGAKLPEPTPSSSMNLDFFNHPPINTLHRSAPAPVTTSPVSTMPVSGVQASVTQVASVNYDFVAQIPNSGPTNFVGTNYKPSDDSGTVWTPLNVGDTFSGVDDFGNAVNIPVGPKIVIQKRSTVNSWLTLSRKGGALRIIN